MSQQSQQATPSEFDPQSNDTDQLAELADHREQYERLAAMDVPISDEAQRVLDALDEWEGQS